MSTAARFPTCKLSTRTDWTSEDINNCVRSLYQPQYVFNALGDKLEETEAATIFENERRKRISSGFQDPPPMSRTPDVYATRVMDLEAARRERCERKRVAVRQGFTCLNHETYRPLGSPVMDLGEMFVKVLSPSLTPEVQARILKMPSMNSSDARKGQKPPQTLDQIRRESLKPQMQKGSTSCKKEVRSAGWHELQAALQASRLRMKAVKAGSPFATVIRLSQAAREAEAARQAELNRSISQDMLLTSVSYRHLRLVDELGQPLRIRPTGHCKTEEQTDGLYQVALDSGKQTDQDENSEAEAEQQKEGGVALTDKSQLDVSTKPKKGLGNAESANVDESTPKDGSTTAQDRNGIETSSKVQKNPSDLDENTKGMGEAVESPNEAKEKEQEAVVKKTQFSALKEEDRNSPSSTTMTEETENIDQNETSKGRSPEAVAFARKLERIHMFLKVICNMKIKHWQSLAPLKREVLVALQQEAVSLEKYRRQTSLGFGAWSGGTSPYSSLSPSSVETSAKRRPSSVASERDRMLQLWKSKTSRRKMTNSNKPEDGILATWEELLAVDPADPEFKKVKLRKQTPLWFRSDWFNPTEEQPDQQSLQTLGARLQMHQECMVNVKNRIRDGLLETLEKQNKESMCKAKERLGTLATLCTFWSRQRELLRDVRRPGSGSQPNCHCCSVKLLPWFSSLKLESELVGLSQDTQVHERLEALRELAEDDLNALVPYVREKLCLLVMSLPVNELCLLHIQEAITFILGGILSVEAPTTVLEKWLQHRGLQVPDPNNNILQP